MNNLGIILNSLQSQEITVIAHAILSDNDEFLILIPIPVYACSQSFRMVFPDIIMTPAKFLHFLGRFNEGDGHRVCWDTSVVTHAEVVNFFEVPGNPFHKPPVGKSGGKPT